MFGALPQQLAVGLKAVPQRLGTQGHIRPRLEQQLAVCLLSFSLSWVLSEILLETGKATVSQMAGNCECWSCHMSAPLLTGNIPDTNPAGVWVCPGILGRLGFSPGNHITSPCKGLHSVGLIISPGPVLFL